ncbi:hypothetical protein, partial [Pseudomonas sp. GW531-R1]|uniref:hypothetical protein n=1 Tax=Pseudomonas sp. GW531-R1 TaxID=2075556 RepID=UPI001C441C56
SLGIFASMSLWISTAIFWMQVLVSMGLGVWQWRKSTQKAAAEKAEMEQRWEREDMELNATVLLPREP